MSEKIPEEIGQFFTDGDKPKFIPKALADDIMKITKFVTLSDTNEIWAYDRGLWKPDGETLIRNSVTTILGDYAKKHHGEEVVYFIRTSTYIERSTFTVSKNLIPLENGVFDIETCQILDYNNKMYFTTKLPLRFNPDAKCEKINAFLTQVTNPEHVLLLKEIAAYCLYRGYPIQTAFMMLGEGSNGKSVYLGLIKRMLGIKNITAVAIQDLEEQQFARAQLFNKMANIYPDLSPRALHNTGVFKMLTGGDTITAQRKFQHPFEFDNYAKMIFSCNQIPIAYDDTTAFHRRWIIINFPFVFDEKTADPNILDKISSEEEMSGFFNELITVLKELLERGHFSYEMTVEQRRELYKRLSDPVEAFYMDMVEFDAEGWETKRTIYTAFCDYCKSKNYAIIADSVFAKRFRKIGELSDGRKGTDKRETSWLGIKIKNESVKDVKEVKGTLNLREFKDGEKVVLSNKKTLPSLPSLTYICDICKQPDKIVTKKQLRDEVTGELADFRVCSDCDKEGSK